MYFFYPSGTFSRNFISLNPVFMFFLEWKPLVCAFWVSLSCGFPKYRYSMWRPKWWTWSYTTLINWCLDVRSRLFWDLDLEGEIWSISSTGKRKFCSRGKTKSETKATTLLQFQQGKTFNFFHLKTWMFYSAIVYFSLGVEYHENTCVLFFLDGMTHCGRFWRSSSSQI